MRLGQIGLWGGGLVCGVDICFSVGGVMVGHLGAQLLLDNNVFHSVLPQHLLPPQPRGQGRCQAGGLVQLHRRDLRCLSKGHHGDFG